MSGRDTLRDVQTSGSSARVEVMFDAKGKLLLPEIPAHNDLAGLCAWLTCVFSLDPVHPIARAVHEGRYGPDGHVALERVAARPIRFEPVARINNPARLIETLAWALLPTDGEIHPIKADHCRQISYVVRMLVGAYHGVTALQEAGGIVSTFTEAAAMVEGCTTYGTPAQRYEAAVQLRRETDPVTGRPFGACRYLSDENTGELVISVSDLQDAARRHEGSSLPRGWLDARMDALGWQRITLDGHAQPGRSGRAGPHARINAYRGHLRPADEDQLATR